MTQRDSSDTKMRAIGGLVILLMFLPFMLAIPLLGVWIVVTLWQAIGGG